jgi:hypothetical protein
VIECAGAAGVIYTSVKRLGVAQNFLAEKHIYIFNFEEMPQMPLCIL